jgi:hypothetical protein
MSASQVQRPSGDRSIQIGSDAACDINVTHAGFSARVLVSGSLGFCKFCRDDGWGRQDLGGFVYRLPSLRDTDNERLARRESAMARGRYGADASAMIGVCASGR